MAYTCFHAPTSEPTTIENIVSGLKKSLFPAAVKADESAPGTIVIGTKGPITEAVRKTVYQAGCAPRNL